jgi:hypothetical protein
MPNPYKGSTTLILHLGEVSSVEVAVISALGQMITLFPEGLLASGKHDFEFGSASHGLGKGVYTARIVVNGNATYLRLLELE